jgi:DNA-binding FadR family transcriptional regulator
MTDTAIATVGPIAEAVRFIEQTIQGQGLRGGDRLPTERELAALAGLSRTTVRNALDALEEQGRVVRQVGRGTYLAPGIGDQVIGRFDMCSPAEIMAARMSLEPQFLPLAVSSATGEDIAEMRRHLHAGDQATDSASFEQADMQLHHAFALATHNSVMVMVSQLLIDARYQPVWGGLKRRSFNQTNHHAYCGEHRAIVDALAERDTDTAQQAMRAHLTHVRTNLLG